jgi:homoserine O-acetyltransferase
VAERRRTAPASGAWGPGDDPGDRRFLTLDPRRTFALEFGGSLRDVTIAYETWGRLDDEGGNAVLVCHALTGDAHAARGGAPGAGDAGWWDGIIGPGRALDTDRYFVVCANALGGCQGSTGPASIPPDGGSPYGPRFPVVTVRDMVRAQRSLADHLGVAAWRSVVGGSMGGMQALEWAVMFPQRVRSVVPIATAAAASAQQIGYSRVGRLAVALDPGWQGGDYYGALDGAGPHRGLGVARELAQITYRTADVYDERFGRTTRDPLDDVVDLWQRFEVEAYLDYHAVKLARRFDANSYLVLNKAMDLHDLARGRGGLTRAVARLRAPVMTTSITSDALYPPSQQEDLHEAIRSVGVPARFAEIDSPHGHDAFLLEDEQVGDLVASFLREVPGHG